MTDKHPALARAYRHATRYLDSLDTRPVTPTASTEALRARLSRPLPGRPPRARLSRPRSPRPPKPALHWLD